MTRNEKVYFNLIRLRDAADALASCLVAVEKGGFADPEQQDKLDQAIMANMNDIEREHGALKGPLQALWASVTRKEVNHGKENKEA